MTVGRLQDITGQRIGRGQQGSFRVLNKAKEILNWNFLCSKYLQAAGETAGAQALMVSRPWCFSSKDMATFGAVGDSGLVGLGLEQSREDPCGDAMGPLARVAPVDWSTGQQDRQSGQRS